MDHDSLALSVVPLGRGYRPTRVAPIERALDAAASEVAASAITPKGGLRPNGRTFNTIAT